MEENLNRPQLKQELTELIEKHFGKLEGKLQADINSIFLEMYRGLVLITKRDFLQGEIQIVTLEFDKPEPTNTIEIPTNAKDIQ